MKKEKTQQDKYTRITSSMLDTFDFCKRKKHLQYDKLLVPKVEPIHFTVGGLWHSIMEDFYRGVPLKKAINNMLRKAKVCLSSKYMTEEREKELEESVIMLQGMATGYYNLYWKDLRRWKIIGIEKSFEFPVTDRKGRILKNEKGYPVLIVGKIDLDITRELKGIEGNWIVEHKSAGTIDTSYVERLSLDRQTSIYFLGAATLHKNELPEGVIYNPVKKCQLRLRKNETRDQYLERIKEDYITRRDFYYHRFKLKKSSQDIQKHKDDIYYACKEMLEIENSIFISKAYTYRWHRRSTFMCTWKGRCEFIPICLGKFNDPVVKSQYREKEFKHEELGL